jgi:flagellar biosynthesis protein FliP
MPLVLSSRWVDASGIHPQPRRLPTGDAHAALESGAAPHGNGPVARQMRTDTIAASPAGLSDTAHATWTDLYRAGSRAAFLAAIAYITAIVVLFTVPEAPTSGGAQTLEYIAQHRTVYIVEQILWLAPNVLLMVVFLALWPVLRPLNPSYAAIGVVLGIASWAAGLAYPASGGGAPALVALSDAYAAATTVAERATFVAAAEGLIAQNNTSVAIGVLQTLAILIVSLVLLRGTFRRSVVWLGIVTGALGLASETLRPIMGLGYIVYGLLVIVWIAAIGWELARLAGTETRAGGNALSPADVPPGEGSDPQRREARTCSV